MRLARPAAALLAVLALAGCRDATGASESLVGTFTLRRVGGEPLPHVTSSGPNYRGGTETVTILESRYDFAADGTVQQTTRTRFQSDIPAHDTVYLTTVPLGWRRSGEVVTVGPRDPCPYNALCLGEVDLLYRGGTRLLVTFPAPVPTLWEYEVVR